MGGNRGPDCHDLVGTRGLRVKGRDDKKNGLGATHIGRLKECGRVQ